MNSFMPSGPEPSPAAPAAAPPMAQSAGPGAPFAPPPQGQAPDEPSPQEKGLVKQRTGAVLDGLLALVAKPRGELTKKAVFDQAADMIARGAFPTPEAKQGLIVKLANLPDDEQQLRQALGQMALQIASIHHAVHTAWGES